MNITKKLQMILLVGFGMMAVACGGKIPSAYQGNFQDNTANVKLTLGGSDATATFADGRVLQTKADDLSFDALSQGKAGVYVRANSADGSKIDVVWSNPDLASKQSNASSNYVWFDRAELIMATLDAKSDQPVQSIKLVHCLDGKVEFFSDNQQIEWGCPASAQSIEAVRVSGK